MVVHNLEAGFFFLILAIGFLFTFVSFRALGNAAYGLRGLAMAMFLILAIVIGSGFQIGMTDTSTQTQKSINTGEVWTENDTNTKVILPGGSTSNWFGWFFSGMAMLNLILVVRSLVDDGKIKGFR